MPIDPKTGKELPNSGVQRPSIMDFILGTQREPKPGELILLDLGGNLPPGTPAPAGGLTQSQEGAAPVPGLQPPGPLRRPRNEARGVSNTGGGTPNIAQSGADLGALFKFVDRAGLEYGPQVDQAVGGARDYLSGLIGTPDEVAQKVSPEAISGLANRTADAAKNVPGPAQLEADTPFLQDFFQFQRDLPLIGDLVGYGQEKIDDVRESLGIARGFGTQSTLNEPGPNPMQGVDGAALMAQLTGGSGEPAAQGGAAGLKSLLGPRQRNVLTQNTDPLDYTQYVAEAPQLEAPDYSRVRELMASARPEGPQEGDSFAPILAGLFQGLAQGDAGNIGQLLLSGAAGGFSGLLSADQQEKEAQRQIREFSAQEAQVESDIEATKAGVRNQNAQLRAGYDQAVLAAKRQNAEFRQPQIQVDDDLITIREGNSDGTVTTRVVQMTDRAKELKNFMYAQAAQTNAQAAMLRAQGDASPLANLSTSAQVGLQFMQDPQFSGFISPEVAEQARDHIDEAFPQVATAAAGGDEDALQMYNELYLTTLGQYGFATLNEFTRQQEQGDR